MNRHGVDGDVLHGTVPRTRGGIGNRIDDSQLTGHFAKDGVFAVEELCRLVGNEELAAIGNDKTMKKKRLQNRKGRKNVSKAAESESQENNFDN